MRIAYSVSGETVSITMPREQVKSNIFILDVKYHYDVFRPPSFCFTQ